MTIRDVREIQGKAAVNFNNAAERARGGEKRKSNSYKGLKRIFVSLFFALGIEHGAGKHAES